VRVRRPPLGTVGRRSDGNGEGIVLTISRRVAEAGSAGSRRVREAEEKKREEGTPLW
jgi:hypothetical protein